MKLEEAKPGMFIVKYGDKGKVFQRAIIINKLSQDRGIFCVGVDQDYSIDKGTIFTRELGDWEIKWPLK